MQHISLDFLALGLQVLAPRRLLLLELLEPFLHSKGVLLLILEVLLDLLQLLLGLDHCILSDLLETLNTGLLSLQLGL